MEKSKRIIESNHVSSLSSKELELIKLVRSIEYGQITAIIKSGRIEYCRREETIKLG